jgi:hypothetical protein
MHWVYGAEWDVMLPTVPWTLVLPGGAVVFAVVSLRGGVRTGARILDGRLAWVRSTPTSTSGGAGAPHAS